MIIPLLSHINPNHPMNPLPAGIPASLFQAGWLCHWHWWRLPVPRHLGVPARGQLIAMECCGLAFLGTLNPEPPHLLWEKPWFLVIFCKKSNPLNPPIYHETGWCNSKIELKTRMVLASWVPSKIGCCDASKRNLSRTFLGPYFSAQHVTLSQLVAGLGTLSLTISWRRSEHQIVWHRFSYLLNNLLEIVYSTGII